MTITNPAAFVQDDAPFVHGAFMASMGDSFASYIDQMKWTNSDPLYSDSGVQSVTPAVVNEILADIGDERKSITPAYMSKSKVRDTSLGGNPAINPLFQYNEDDDMPSVFTIDRKDGSLGMGEVYSSEIDDKQCVLYLQAGRPKFNNIAAFWSGAIDPDMALLNDRGVLYSTAYKIGRLITTPLSLIVTLPTIAVEWLYRWGTYKEAPITSYYDFQSEQPLYYRYVNTILLILTTNMGFMESSTDERDDGNADDQAMQKAQLDQDTKVDQANGNYTPPPGSPDYIYKLQMDISLILRKRMKYIYGASQVSDKSNDTLIHEFIAAQDGATDDDEAFKDSGTVSSSTSTTSPPTPAIEQAGSQLASGHPLDALETAMGMFKTYRKNMMDGIKIGSDLGTYYMMQYIGFRLESTVSTQESIHNTPKRPEIDQAANGKFAAVRDKAFTAMGSISSAVPVIGGVLSGMVDTVKGALDGILSNTGMDGLAQLAAGSAMVSIPKVWDNSEFSSTTNFEVHLRSAAGDDLSILQDIYVPFACLLALAAPRAQGNASYTAPFLVKAFSKGTVSIPMGMITNLNIVRGASQHGWSVNMKPTEMKLSFEIEDLTPTMFVTMGSSGWKQKIRDIALGTNNKFTSYLEMLAGVDLHAKVGWQAQKRRAKLVWRSLFQTKYAGLVDGMRIGSLPPSRIIAAITPASWIKGPSANSHDAYNM